MGYTMAITVLAFFAAYFIVASRSNVDVLRLVNRMVWFVAFTGVVYFCESYFEIGLRSSEGRDSASFAFEIQRVHGPLFGAACGYFLLLPAIGAALDRVLSNQKTLVIDLAVLFALAVSLVGLGSRGAMISIVVFMSTFVILNRKSNYKVIWLITILFVFAVAVLLVYSKASSEKITTLEDNDREETYKAAFNLVSSNGLSCFFGTGYGGVWSWYLPDVEDGGALHTRSFFVATKYGVMLYNPHSVMLMLIVEFGAVGFLFFVKLLQLPIFLMIKSWTNYRSPGISSALLACSLAYFLDFPVFKYWSMSLLWWIFALGALRIVCKDNVNPCISQVSEIKQA
jgi:O-antigen ligase